MPQLSGKSSSSFNLDLTLGHLVTLSSKCPSGQPIYSKTGGRLFNLTRSPGDVNVYLGGLSRIDDYPHLRDRSK
jgi:hypothetical protein